MRPSILLLSLLLLMPITRAAPLDSSQAAVLAFVERLTADGFSEAQTLAWLNQADIKSSILAVMDKPSTSRAWYQFAPNFFTDKNVRWGMTFRREQAAPLTEAQRRFGVPPAIITGILGVETGYGRNTGRWRTLDALATLAFHYPRRAAYFQDELREFLLLCKEEGLEPTAPRGSFAGALGWPQFMPSNVRKLAIDFDNDGHRDVWNDAQDAIGSVAHYLQAMGWQAGAPIAVPARVAADRDTTERLLAEKFQLHYTLEELAQLGITPREPVTGNPQALLFRLETEDGFEYWLGFTNFYVITRYNKSINYAMTVWQLGEQIEQAYLTSAN